MRRFSLCRTLYDMLDHISPGDVVCSRMVEYMQTYLTQNLLRNTLLLLARLAPSIELLADSLSGNSIQIINRRFHQPLRHRIL
jgi:hypothetical protein